MEDIANLITEGLQPEPGASAPVPVDAGLPAAAAPAVPEGDQLSGDGAQAPLSEKELKGVFSGMMDERTKRQEAQARADKAEKELADIRAKAARPAPSFKDNPEAAAHAQAAELRFDMSEEIALTSGIKQEDIDAAKEWGLGKASKNPAFAAEYLHQRHPIGWIVKAHKRDQTMSAVGEDPDEFVRKRAAELGFVLPDADAQQPAGASAAAPPAAKPAPPTPRPSLASAPSAGSAGAAAVGGMTAIDALPIPG